MCMLKDITAWKAKSVKISIYSAMEDAPILVVTCAETTTL